MFPSSDSAKVLMITLAFLTPIIGTHETGFLSFYMNIIYTNSLYLYSIPKHWYTAHIYLTSAKYCHYCHCVRKVYSHTYIHIIHKYFTESIYNSHVQY